MRAADAEVAAAAPSGAEPSEAGSPVLSAEALAAVPAAVKDRLRAALQSAMLGDLLEAARESLAVWQWVARRPPSPLPFKLSLNPVPKPAAARRGGGRLARGTDAASPRGAGRGAGLPPPPAARAMSFAEKVKAAQQAQKSGGAPTPPLNATPSSFAARVKAAAAGGGAATPPSAGAALRRCRTYSSE